MGANVTAPIKKFGAWVARSNTTVYQAASDGIVVGSTNAASALPFVDTDGANPPTTVRYRSRRDYNIQWVISPVKKDDYYQLNACELGGYWIPLAP